MKGNDLWKVGVAISGETEDAVTEMFQQCFSESPSVHTNLKTGKTTVSLYLTEPPDRSSDRFARLKAGLRAMRECGLDIGPGRISISKIRLQDWAESWKRHFPPMQIGGILLIKPTWSRRQGSASHVVVELDPGLSFGTGHHPTTRYCLEELVRYRPRRSSASFLDVGTGSGILAITAAKLGFCPVEAFDVDPSAVRMARENAALNGLSASIRIVKRDLTRGLVSTRRRFTVICANLSEDVLIDHQAILAGCLAPEGHLVLAGIPTPRFDQLEQVYLRAGLVRIRSKQTREWRSGTFSFKSLGVNA